MQEDNQRQMISVNFGNTASSKQLSLGREDILCILSRANEIAASVDVSGIIQGMMDLMLEVTQGDSAYFFLLDPMTSELVLTHIRGEEEGQYLVGLRLNKQQSIPAISLHDTKTMLVGDMPSDPIWLRTLDLGNPIRKKNVINLPVLYQDQTLGVILVFNYQQTEIDLLLILCARLALELVRMKETEAIQQSHQRLLSLVEMLGDVAGTLDRNRLLHLVAEDAARLVDAERSSLFLVDPDTSEIVYQIAYHPPEPTPLGDLEGSSLSSKSAQLGKKPIRKTGPLGFKEGEFSYFNRSAITVPLQSEPHTGDSKHALGGLLVLNKPRAAFQEEDAQLMRILADQASSFLQVVEMYESAGELFLGVVKSLAAAIDAKDPYTQGHSQRVSDYSVMIANELGFDETSVNDIRIGSLLHDIGKIGIPDAILLKKDKLTSDEMRLMQEHPRTGANILAQVKLLAPMSSAILEHHERLDGSGYPAKLTEKQISWMGKIVAVADVFDAMTSDRPYRKGMKIPEVVDYLKDQAGILFDVSCVQALENILENSNQL